MGIDLEQYQYVVIDASIYRYTLDDEMCQGLKALPDKKLCAASTFPSELREFSQFLADTEAYLEELFREHPNAFTGVQRGNRTVGRLYQENLKRLRNARIKPYIRHYNDYAIQDRKSHHDTWSLVRRLSRECAESSGRLLVLTANVPLILRIRLSDPPLPVDIYPEPPKWLSSGPDLNRIEENIKIDNADFGPNKDLVLYNSAGEPVALKRVVNTECEGSEAYLYNVTSNENLIAKVYRPGSQNLYFLSDQLQKNILAMRQFYDTGLFPWVMLPCDILYAAPPGPDADQSERLIVGYLMNKIDTALLFENHKMFNGSTRGTMKYRDLLRLCRFSLRNLAYMSSYGIFFVDCGRNNIAEFLNWSEREDGVRGLFYLDVCSCSYRSFYSRMEPEGLTNQFDYDLRQKSGVLGYFYEMTHLHALQILTCLRSIEPLEASGMMNIIDPDAEDRLHYQKLVSPNLQDLTEDLYAEPELQKERPFSIEILLEEVSTALHSFPAEDITYDELLEQSADPNSSPYLGFESRTQEDILPCIRESWQKDVVVIKRTPNVVPPVPEPDDDQQHNTDPESAQSPQPTPVKNPKKSYNPTARSSGSSRRKEPARNPAVMRTEPDPIKPASNIKRGIWPALMPYLAVVAALLMLVGLDMLVFSANNLGFSLAGYWNFRWGTIVTFFGPILRSLADGLSGILTPTANIYSGLHL